MTDEPRNPPLRGLRVRRVFRRLTQQELADLISINQSHYRQFESGHVRLDVRRAKVLADYLSCKIEDLL